MKSILAFLLSIAYTNTLLKIYGVIKCSWVLVLMPVWIPIVLFIIAILLLLWAVSEIDNEKSIL